MRNYVLSDAYKVNLNSGTDGYQPKYQRNGYWYKLDSESGEGYTEALVSRLLSYSTLPKSTYVHYEYCKINGKEGCRSKSFTATNEEFISFDSLYSTYIGGNLQTELNLLSAKDRYNLLLDIGRKCCNLDLSVYFRAIFLLDYLIENIDRHTKNIGVIYNENKGIFRIAPIFDNGRSLRIGLSPSEKGFSRTISGSFAEQLIISSGFPVKPIFKVRLGSCLNDPVIAKHQFLVSQLKSNIKLLS